MLITCNRWPLLIHPGATWIRDGTEYEWVGNEQGLVVQNDEQFLTLIESGLLRMIRPPKPPVTPKSEERNMRQEHESHGMILASRTTGGDFHLFGSRLTHNATIEIRISEGESCRRLQSDQYLNGRELVSVRLSEAQWASFVSAMNVGSGVPCTLEHIGGQRFERCPPPEDSIRQHTTESRESLFEALTGLRDLSVRLGGALTGSSVSKREVGEIKRRMDVLLANLPANLEYAHKIFEEHVEEVVAEAKSSVEAHVLAVVTQMGIEATVRLPQGFSEPRALLDAQFKEEDKEAGST